VRRLSGSARIPILTLATMMTVAVVADVMPAEATSTTFALQPASAIVAQARAAMTAAGSVSANGSGSGSGPGVGKVEISEQNYSGTTSGIQHLKVSSIHAPGAALPMATAMNVGGQVYVDANAAFWVSSAGMTNSQAIILANRWIQIPSSSSLYATAAADLTMPSLVSDLFSASTFHKGRILSVDGVRSIAITYSNSGDDAGPATCEIPLGGKHLPLAATIQGITFRFGSWGKAKLIRAPKDAVSLSSLVSPGEATT
jgi:hypothetical protein